MSSGLTSGFCLEVDGEDAGKETHLGGIGHRADIGEVGLFNVLQLPLLG